MNLLGDQLSRSQQPLVPQQLFVASGGDGGASPASSLLSQLLALLVADKANTLSLEQVAAAAPETAKPKS